jgi:hypothetical protein
MLGSNQRFLPCEGSKIGCWRFPELTESLEIVVFLRVDGVLRSSGELGEP